MAKSIYFNRSNDPKRLINIFKELGGFLSDDLSIKIINDNFGFYSNKNIERFNKFISIPKELFISKEVFLQFINEEKINYYNIEFLKEYFQLLPDFTHFEKKHPLMLNNDDKNIILSTLNKNYHLEKFVHNKFENFKKNNSSILKYVDLIFKTRAFYSNKLKDYFLCPVLDFLNFNYFEWGPLENDESIFFQNINRIYKNQELFHSYNSKADPIRIFMDFGFYPNNYRSITIKPEEIDFAFDDLDKINFDDNLLKKIDSKKITNKIEINFENALIPDSLNKILSIYVNKNDRINVFLNIIDLYEKSLKLEQIDNILNDSKLYNQVVVDYSKSCKLYLENLKIIKTIFLKKIN